MDRHDFTDDFNDKEICLSQVLNAEACFTMICHRGDDWTSHIKIRTDQISTLKLCHWCHTLNFEFLVTLFFQSILYYNEVRNYSHGNEFTNSKQCTVHRVMFMNLSFMYSTNLKKVFWILKLLCYGRSALRLQKKTSHTPLTRFSIYSIKTWNQPWHVS